MCKPGSEAIGKGYLIANNLITDGNSIGVEIDSSDKLITGLLVRGNVILDCKHAGIRAICRLGDKTGNYVAGLIEGNVCNGNPSPQVELVGFSSGLIIRNNIE